MLEVGHAENMGKTAAGVSEQPWGIGTHRLQKARVPKFLSMTPSSCLARGRRRGTWPQSKFFM